MATVSLSRRARIRAGTPEANREIADQVGRAAGSARQLG
jgi:hypothetical protein